MRNWLNLKICLGSYAWVAGRAVTEVNVAIIDFPSTVAVYAFDTTLQSQISPHTALWELESLQLNGTQVLTVVMQSQDNRGNFYWMLLLRNPYQVKNQSSIWKVVHISCKRALSRHSLIFYYFQKKYFPQIDTDLDFSDLIVQVSTISF